MAAIAFCPVPNAPAPLRLVPTRPAVRHQPSMVVRRRRGVVVLVALAALGLLLGVGSLADAGQVPAVPNLPDGRRSSLATVPVAATTHVVQPGDTLWTLARRLHPEGDVRPLVARLRARHGSGALVPGQRLRIAT